MNAVSFWPTALDVDDRVSVELTHAAQMSDVVVDRSEEAHVDVPAPADASITVDEGEIDSQELHEEVVRQAMSRIYELREYAQEEDLVAPTASAVREYQSLVTQFPHYFSASMDRMPGVFLSEAGGLELVFESPTNRRRSEIAFEPGEGIELWFSEGAPKHTPFSAEALYSLISEGFAFVWGTPEG